MKTMEGIPVSICLDCITLDELDEMRDHHLFALLVDCEDSYFTCMRCNETTGESNE
jgi:hypothetical protein